MGICASTSTQNTTIINQITTKAKQTSILSAMNSNLHKIPNQWTSSSLNQQLIEIWLQNNRLTDISLALNHFGGTSTQLIYLNNNNLSQLPKHAISWTALQECNISSNPLYNGEIPKDVAFQWNDLRQLYLNDLPLLSKSPIPNTAVVWKQLRVLHLNRSSKCTAEGSIGMTLLSPIAVAGWKELKQFCCNNNSLQVLPSEIKHWIKVEKIFINNNNLLSLPVEIGMLQCLTKLYLSGNQLSTLPDEIGDLTHLDELYINQNQLKTLPNTIGKLSNLTKLYVDDNLLTILPNSIFHGCVALQILHVNRNYLKSIPGYQIERKNEWQNNNKIMFVHIGGNHVSFDSQNMISFLKCIQQEGMLSQLRVLEIQPNNCFLNGTTNGNECQQKLDQVKQGLIKSWSFVTSTNEEASSTEKEKKIADNEKVRVSVN